MEAILHITLGHQDVFIGSNQQLINAADTLYWILSNSHFSSEFLTGQMFVRRTYFGQFDEL